MRKRLLTGIGALALIAGSTVTSTSAAPATRGSVPTLLVGTWGKTITAATWRAHGITYEVPGHWSIVITKRGVTRIFTPPAPKGSPLTTMRVAGTGAKVVFGPTADGFCPTKASYRWRASGRTLVLTAVRDSCEARRVLLTAGPWTKR